MLTHGSGERLPELQAIGEKLLFLSADGDLEDAPPNTRVGRALREDFGFRVDILENTTHNAADRTARGGG